MNRLLETNSCKNRARWQTWSSSLGSDKREHKKNSWKDAPQHSANKVAAEANVSRRTVQVILNEYLGFRPYRKRNFQGLTKSQRIKMIQWSTFYVFLIYTFFNFSPKSSHCFLMSKSFVYTTRVNSYFHLYVFLLRIPSLKLIPK